MDRGVVILCMRKPQYACAAFNLALSIKRHSPDMNITLLTDGIHNKAFSADHFSVFNFITEIKEKSVAEAKVNIGKYVDYKHNLYIDADSICVQPLEPLFDKLKGNEFKSNVIDNYTLWTTKEAFQEFFNVDTWQTINSSWMYFENIKVFDTADKYFQKGFDRDKLDQVWGGHIPDELFFNGALAKLGIDAKVDFEPMLFDDKKKPIQIGKMCDEYYFVTFYGNQNSTRLELREWYDREMFRICAHYNMEHRFKMHEIITHKLVNEK